MCVVSNIIDHSRHTWNPPAVPFNPTQLELDEIRRRLNALEELLKHAKLYDIETGQPDCETQSKKDELQKLADEYNIEIDFL